MNVTSHATKPSSTRGFARRADRLDEVAEILRRMLDITVTMAPSAGPVLVGGATTASLPASHAGGEAILTVHDGARRLVVPVGSNGEVLVCELPSGASNTAAVLDTLRLVELVASAGPEPEDQDADDEFRLDELQQFAEQTITARHHTFALEHALEDMIRAGDDASLTRFLGRKPIDLSMGQLSASDALRSQKDIAICLITIATRSASDGGLPIDTAFSLSDSYIRKLEGTRSADGVADVIRSALLDLARRVGAQRQNLRPNVIQRSESYIAHNLHGDVSTAAVAAHVGVRPHYLAQLFRTRLGTTVSQYTADARVHAAKQLLVSTDIRLIEICDRLGFYDQSHFTRTFKRLTGATPKQFRDEHAGRRRSARPRTEGTA